MELHNLIPDIPKGKGREDIKSRRQIIKDYYTSWVINYPDKKVWNESLHEYIYVKNRSYNEILGHAPRSYESTYAFTQLTELLQKARYVESLPPKMRDQNQKIFSKLILLRWKNYRVLVGHQKSTGDTMLYYIGGGPKK